MLDLFGIISDEVDDAKLRRVVIDRPRFTRNISNIAAFSAKRDASPNKFA